MESKFFFKAYNHLWTDPHKDLIEGLSTLELCLLLSFVTFELHSENPQYNFERSYENYFLFASSKHAPGSLQSKPVALKVNDVI